MSSVVIAGDTSGTVTLAAPAVSGTTTITLPATSGTLLQSGTAVTVAQGGTGLTAVGTSGNLLTSNGTTWASTAPAAAGSMTLLGTVTATSGNSVSLGSLVLTSYINLQIIYKDIVVSTGSICYISSSNSQDAAHFAAYMPTATPVVNEGFVILNLPTGNFIGGGGNNVNSTIWASAPCGQTNVTTASTIIYFRLASTYTYGGSGSILVYGVK